MEASRIGNGSRRDTRGCVLAGHWLMPYRTLGYPRTQVWAAGARQVAAVHGGVRAKLPLIVIAPREPTDMPSDPAPAGSPRFHSSPLSWAERRTGAAASQLAPVPGAKGHRPVQIQARPLAP